MLYALNTWTVSQYILAGRTSKWSLHVLSVSLIALVHCKAGSIWHKRPFQHLHTLGRVPDAPQALLDALLCSCVPSQEEKKVLIILDYPEQESVVEGLPVIVWPRASRWPYVLFCLFKCLCFGFVFLLFSYFLMVMPKM